MKASDRATRMTSRSRPRVRAQSVSIYRAHKEVRAQQCLKLGKFVQISSWASPPGPSGWDKESGLLDQSAQLSPAGCSQAGELGGFQAVEKQQSKSDQCGGDPCCCHTGAKENSKQNGCMKSWTGGLDFIKCIIKDIFYLMMFLCLCLCMCLHMMMLSCSCRMTVRWFLFELKYSQWSFTIVFEGYVHL